MYAFGPRLVPPFWDEIAPYLMVLSWHCSCSVLVPGIGMRVNGAAVWLR